MRHRRRRRVGQGPAGNQVTSHTVAVFLVRSELEVAYDHEQDSFNARVPKLCTLVLRGVG